MQDLYEEGISIHSPLRGETKSGIRMGLMQKDFNPLASERRDLRRTLNFLLE